jgi:hypothetical protein
VCFSVRVNFSVKKGAQAYLDLDIDGWVLV